MSPASEYLERISTLNMFIAKDLGAIPTGKLYNKMIILYVTIIRCIIWSLNELTKHYLNNGYEVKFWI